MTTPNYHPTPPKVAPRSEKSTELSSSKPASANPKMKEKGTSEKPTKQKMKENDNGACLHRENPPGTQVASLMQYEKFIKELNPRQLTYIHLIRQGELLKTRGMRMRRLSCPTIAYSYDAEQDAFIIHEGPCRITLKDVEHITGVPCMGKNHVSSNHNDNLELWKELKDPNDTKVTLKGLLANMKGDNKPNFVRPFVLYTIGKYVCPTTQEYVDNTYLGIVRNVETIKSTNFGQLTLDHLMASIRKFVNGGANLKGNLPLLQYVDELMRPFNPPQVGTPVKLKTDGQDKTLIARVLADLKDIASIVWEPSGQQFDRMMSKTEMLLQLARRVSRMFHGFIKSWMLRRDPLDLKHDNNVRKAEERRNQDDKDVSIEVRERQREDSVVDSMLPTRVGSRKRAVSSLLSNEDYVLYDSDKKRKKNRTPSESSNDSKDTKNTKRKNRASNLKDTDTGASRPETDLDKFRQIYVAEIVNTSDLDKQLVVIDDIVLLQKHLQCLTMTDGGEDDKWLGDELVDAVIQIMHHDRPKDIRDGQLVYIERVAGIAMLEIDVEDIHLSDLGAPSHPMEASVGNVEQNFYRGKQKDGTEVAAKHHCKQGIKNDDVEPPMKNRDEDIDDQAFERTAIKIKQDLSVVHKLFKEVDDIEGAPSLDDESFRKQQEVVDATIQLMRHDEPIDTRDDKMVYIERLAGVAKLERDGRIEECYEDALADIPGTTQGTSYLKHDIVF
ncbi:hypothetical protein D1007_36204 [Hordeum vulgare]|nr:hypothetical protein D1007_36204 [Hordeum vulgare]